MQIDGVLIEGGIVCPLFQTPSGEVISLMGLEPARYLPGTTLQLEGQIVKYSTCQQGKKTFQVSRVMAANGKTP